MGKFVKVAKTAAIAPGEGNLVDDAGKKIALFNVDGTFYAIEETCTHRGGPRSEGLLMGIEVTCPWHGAVFDVRTGNVLAPPAPQDVARYNVRVQGNDIEIEL
jgi:nitrite reductase/ring-hydroxylating ferredoxin subunit